MKKGQVCRGKGIDALYYGCRSLKPDDRRTFWKQHRTAENNEIRRICHEIETPSARKLRLETSLAKAEHAARVLQSKVEPDADTLTPRERVILDTMGS